MNLQDTIEFRKFGTQASPGAGITYLIFKRPKDVFGAHRYYFAGKKVEDELPFVQKYSPILDSDKDKFDKIEELAECGGDVYVIVLKTNETLRYLKFTVFDKEPQVADEKTLKACKRGRP